MFHHVDDALEALLRDDEPLLADATITFDDPVEGEHEPELRLVLRRVVVSAKGAASGTEVIERDGVKVRRSRLPTVELSYEVSAPAGDARARHRLLAAALRVLLRHGTVPAEHVPDELVDASGPLTLRVPRQDPGDVAPAPDRPATIDLRVSLLIDLAREQVLADAPGSSEFGFEDRDSGATSSRRRYAGHVSDPAAAGVDVLGPAGAASVDADGRFVIVARPGDTIVVMTDPPVTATVPDAGRITVG